MRGRDERQAHFDFDVVDQSLQSIQKRILTHYPNLSIFTLQIQINLDPNIALFNMYFHIMSCYLLAFCREWTMYTATTSRLCPIRWVLRKSFAQMMTLGPQVRDSAFVATTHWCLLFMLRICTFPLGQDKLFCVIVTGKCPTESSRNIPINEARPKKIYAFPCIAAYQR